MKEELHNAPRPLRFYSHCKHQGYTVNVVCPSSKEDEAPQKPIVEISNPTISAFQRALLRLGRALLPSSKIKNKINETLYDLRELRKLLEESDFDLIYVADLHMLPIIVKARENAKIIFDAREYYPLQYEDSLSFRFLEKDECIRILKQTLSHCDKVLTVSPGLANAYKKNFGITAELLLSLPSYQDQTISNVSDKAIKILYHGMANRNRKIENYINLLEHLHVDAELHLYLVGDKIYIEELKNVAIDNLKVIFHEPVEFKNIISTVNKYDIGICYYEPTSFNLRHCLPNKFFEYIQARLVIAIGPSPDMAEITKEYQCGIVSEDFSIKSLSLELNSLTRAKINTIKQNSDRAAKEFCFENEEIKFSRIIEDLHSK